MDEPRQHDRGASLTESVRQFRRMARLAAADPLRLLPIDALTRLASLSAPIADLIDLAPFERLRQALTAPPAAPRRDAPRMRPHPGGAAGTDVRQTPAASSAPVSINRNAASAPPLESSAVPASLRLVSEPLRRDVTAAATLAERRATLRRETTDVGLSTEPVSPFVAPAVSPAVARRKSSGAPAETGGGGPSGQRISGEIDDQARRAVPVPFDPVVPGRDDAASASNALLSSTALNRTMQDPLFAGDPRSAPVPIGLPGAPGIPAPFDTLAGPGVVHSGPSHPGPSLIAHAPSSPFAGPWPQAARTPHPDAATAPRRRGWESRGEPGLADALFDALYRDGVDLPWP